MAASRKALLKFCAWLVHLYTASGAVVALFAVDMIARNDFRDAFFLMAVAIVIDSTDGPFARALKVRERIPIFDGATLDNIVDYLNYVAVPVFLIRHANLLLAGDLGLALDAFVLIASAYGFCRFDAKTEDGYFRGFPSYWNLVALYLYCLHWPPCLNTFVVFVLAMMVFLPTKYIYPNRTIPLRSLTLTLATIWGLITIVMLFQLPRPNPVWLYISLTFIVYYFIMSFALQAAPLLAKVKSGNGSSRWVLRRP